MFRRLTSVFSNLLVAELCLERVTHQLSGHSSYLHICSIYCFHEQMYRGLNRHFQALLLEYVFWNIGLHWFYDKFWLFISLVELKEARKKRFTHTVEILFKPIQIKARLDCSATVGSRQFQCWRETQQLMNTKKCATYTALIIFDLPALIL